MQKGVGPCFVWHATQKEKTKISHVGLKLFRPKRIKRKKKERTCGLVRVCSAQAKEERNAVWAWGVLGPKWRGVGDS